MSTSLVYIKCISFEQVIPKGLLSRVEFVLTGHKFRMKISVLPSILIVLHRLKSSLVSYSIAKSCEFIVWGLTQV
jgi:hypothetical protein